MTCLTNDLDGFCAGITVAATLSPTLVHRLLAWADGSIQNGIHLCEHLRRKKKQSVCFTTTSIIEYIYSYYSVTVFVLAGDRLPTT